MVGEREITKFLETNARSDLDLALGDEVLGAGRAAFSITCTFPDGKRVFERTIVEIAEEKIIRQVDVEA
jgi:hypothetical protein